MKWIKWTDQKPDTSFYYEILFVDNKNRICDIKVKGSDGIWNRTDVNILATRVIEVITPKVKRPVGPTKTFYWNWETHKLWPKTIKVPPNTHLPYFKIDVEIDNPTQIHYSIHGTEYFSKNKFDWKNIRCFKPEVDIVNNLVYIES